MKTAVLILILFANINCTDSTTVYVCASPNARRYHYKSDCRGLSNCTYRIIKTTLSDAKDKGKTQCGWEK